MHSNLMKAPLMQDLDIVLHLHIPKCAGTSLRTSVFQSLPENNCIEWNSSNPYDLDISIDEFEATLLSYPNARFVSGHFPYGIHTVLKGKGYKYITVLRNPIDRVLSAYRHTVMDNLYLLQHEEAELIINGGFDAYIRSHYAEITFLNTQARLISGMLTNEQLYSVALPDFLTACLDIISRVFVHVGIQSEMPKTLGFLSNFFSIPSSHRLIESNSNSRGNTQCCSVLPQQDIDHLASANSYDLALIDRLFGLDANSLKSGASSLEKQEYIYSTLCSSALRMSNQLREIRNVIY